MNRQIVLPWAGIVATWVLFTTTAYYITGTLIETLLIVSGNTHLMRENSVTAYFLSGFQYLEALLFGVLFGSVFFWVNYGVDRMGIQRYSFGQVLLLKSAIYAVSVPLIFSLIFWLLKTLHILPEAMHDLKQIGSAPTQLLLAMSILITGFIAFLNFLILIVRKFGPNHLLPMLLGKYQTPHTEDRIFLFLDLKSSTTFAEKLGHIQYSLFLRDCFHELNHVVPRYDAEIYQYVGDEAVLTWPLAKGLRHSNCLHLFFAFQDRLNKRSRYFLKKYGIVPEFKAGLNAGTVTVAEVGDIKREIAYHGDVLNTGARIQGVCNQFGRNLLISKKLADLIGQPTGFELTYLGEVQLRGKMVRTEVLAVDKRLINKQLQA